MGMKKILITLFVVASFCKIDAMVPVAKRQKTLIEELPDVVCNLIGSVFSIFNCERFSENKAVELRMTIENCANRRGDRAAEVLDFERLVEECSQADINAKIEGWSALHSALIYGEPELACLLIRKGSDIHLKADDGETALHLAAKYLPQNSERLDDWKEVIDLLLKQGASVNAQDDVGRTPFSHVAKCGYNSIADVNRFIKEDADVFVDPLIPSNLFFDGTCTSICLRLVPLLLRKPTVNGLYYLLLNAMKLSSLCPNHGSNDVLVSSIVGCMPIAYMIKTDMIEIRCLETMRKTVASVLLGLRRLLGLSYKDIFPIIFLKDTQLKKYLVVTLYASYFSNVGYHIPMRLFNLIKESHKQYFTFEMKADMRRLIRNCIEGLKNPAGDGRADERECQAKLDFLMRDFFEKEAALLR